MTTIEIKHTRVAALGLVLATSAHQVNGGGGSAANGCFAVFNSEAADLIPAGTSGATDVSVRDRETGTI